MTPRDDSDSSAGSADNDGRWSDLDRPPLNAGALRRALVRDGGLWSGVEVVRSTGSTNADLVALAGKEGGVDEGAVLIAEEQTAGRGRLDRQWTAPARSGLFFSVLLKPTDVPVARWGWLPLLTGVAVATGLSRAAGVDTSLKWPNDLLVSVGGAERKAGGILAERAGADAVVIGIGINVTLREDELPVPTAGSLALRRRRGHGPGSAAAGGAAGAGAVVRAVAGGGWGSRGLGAPGDVCGGVCDVGADGAGGVAGGSECGGGGGCCGRGREVGAGHGGGGAGAGGGGGCRAPAAGVRISPRRPYPSHPRGLPPEPPLRP